MMEPADDDAALDIAIAHDVACHRCAYNLRGLRADGRCPECGAPVSVSLQGERLRFADPVWLTKLSRGAKIPAYTLQAVLLLFLVVNAIQFVLGRFVDVSGIKWLSDAGLLGLFAVGCAALLCGVWLVATPNEHLRTVETWRAPRRILRACVLLAVIGSGLGAAAFASARTNPAWFVIVMIISPVGIVSVVGSWALCRYVRELADRLPDDFTARKARSYLGGYVVSWLLFAGAGSLGFCTYGLPVGLAVFLPGLVGVMAFGVLCLFLPSYLAKNVEAELKKARDAWKEGMEEAKTG